MGFKSSYRPLDRTKSISAPRSSFFVKSKKIDNRSHFWAGSPREPSLEHQGTSRPTVSFRWVFLFVFCSGEPDVEFSVVKHDESTHRDEAFQDEELAAALVEFDSYRWTP